MTSFVKSAAGRTTHPSNKPRTISQLFSQHRIDSFPRELQRDPESDKEFPNQTPREVKSGHYVLTKPQPITNPVLVSGSNFFATTCLGLDTAEFSNSAFPKVFAGDLGAIPGDGAESPAQPWATPYAVSVFGQPIMAPDPFGTGNGYGDGRAMSIAELQGVNGNWELQLKGCGTTPFSRGADGRAVLRSSVREYLVSNAMHHLGVPTTLALSLVASADMTVDRPWYPPEYRGRARAPMMMQTEQCAITCRASSSFIRLGQFELFSRRVARGVPGALEQLRELVAHAVQREYPEVLAEGESPGSGKAVVKFLRGVMKRLAKTSAKWVQVGYVQGNMNSDNMLVNGNTLDYGPFGFVEKFSPLWSPFTSDPEKKFGFMRQPMAMQVNIVTLARALVPLVADEEGGDELIDEMQAVVGDEYRETIERFMFEMKCAKLGYESVQEADKEQVDQLWEDLVELMTKSEADYTMFFRQLAKLCPSGEDVLANSASLPLALHECFYKDPSEVPAVEINDWLKRWHQISPPQQAIMNRSNPVYVPREWILVNAYERAERGDYSGVKELETLFEDPYAEQSETLKEKFFALTPNDMIDKGGVAFFS